MTFQEHGKFRQTKVWKEFRKKIVEERHSTCECCGIKKKGLQLHHIDVENYTVLDPTQFFLLCSCCHDTVERFAKRFRGKKANTIKHPDLWLALFGPFFPKNYNIFNRPCLTLWSFHNPPSELPNY